MNNNTRHVLSITRIKQHKTHKYSLTALSHIKQKIGVVPVTFDTTDEPTNAARAELCCHKLCLARRRKTKSTGSRIGEAK